MMPPRVWPLGQNPAGANTDSKMQILAIYCLCVFNHQYLKEKVQDHSVTFIRCFCAFFCALFLSVFRFSFSLSISGVSALGIYKQLKNLFSVILLYNIKIKK